MTLTDHRQQAALDAAVHQIATTATSVAERASEMLGVLAQSSVRIADRDLLNAAQFELRRNMVEFQRTFRTVLGERVEQALAPPGPGRHARAATNWQSLSLVDDSEVEERMFSDRIGQMIAHECDAELRELAAYMGTLLLTGRPDQEHNPLSAEALGAALYRAIEMVSEQAEARKLLARELGQAMAKAMPACYGHILSDLQARGVQPVSLVVRTVEGPGNLLPGISSGYGTPGSTRSQHGDLDAGPHSGGEAGYTRGQGMGHEFGHAAHSTRAMSNPTLPSSLSGAPSRTGAVSSFRGLNASQAADAQLMALLRRLTSIASRPGELDSLHRHSGAGGYPGTGQVSRSGVGAIDLASAGAEAGPASAGDAYADGLTGLMAVNLIRAHREELMQASTGKLDHMVIDVVGSLFDQILSDARVPPQMARQIARLQLPVLRVALNDPTFFSSRRHPVRRFVNRIASLACAFDDFDDGPGKSFMARVRELVEEIVEGDFDQIDLYASKLAALESFISEQTHAEAQQNGAAETLGAKESELRLQQRYMLQLQGALKAVTLPPYLREFLPQVWSQALVLAATRDGPQSDRAKRYRRVGCDLVMSVQPKGSPAMRKRFLIQLPPLMKDLNEGLRLIGWPAAAQREFFAQLLPAHAESLKGAPMSELDHNLLVKQLQSVFNIPVPGTESLSTMDEVPDVDEAVIAQRFTPEEAQRVGLVEESAVDWSGQVDVDLSEGESTSGADSAGDSTDSASLDLAPGLNLGAAAAEPPEPSRGPQLMEHIQLGFAYQMHLKDEWQKVRLTHVSAGRGFFVFTRGRKHQETISMTARMLARMCDTGRLRAFENAYLMERATQRARKQLAALKTSSRL